MKDEEPYSQQGVQNTTVMIDTTIIEKAVEL